MTDVRCLTCFPAVRIDGKVAEEHTPQDRLKPGDKCTACGSMFLSMDTVPGAGEVSVWARDRSRARVAP